MANKIKAKPKKKKLTIYEAIVLNGLNVEIMMDGSIIPSQNVAHLIKRQLRDR